MTNHFAKLSNHAQRATLAIVVAFDPGETTGFAVLGIHPDHLTSQPPSARPSLGLSDCLDHIEYGEIDCGARHGETGMGMLRGHAGLNLYGESMGVDQMVELLRHYDAKSTAVVIEDFIVDFNQITSERSALSPVRITAAFSYAIKDRLQSVFVQNRGNVKQTCTDDRLKNWGLYDANSGPHARDAIRHAYYFIRDSRGFSDKARERRWLAWPHLFPDPWMQKVKGSSRRGSSGGERIPGLG